MFILQWWRVASKAKKPLNSTPLSPQKQLLSITAMKARDNRGIPTTALSVVGSWQLTQVGVRCCPSFEGYLLKRNAASLGSVPCFGSWSCFWEVARWWIPAQEIRSGCQKMAPNIQKLPGNMVSLCRGWLLEGVTLSVSPEVKLDCWAAGSSSASYQLDGPRPSLFNLGCAQLKCIGRKVSVNWVCHSLSKHHFI